MTRIESKPAGRPFSLAGGRPNLAIPGPSMMPDRVLAAMAEPMSNIYGGELVDMSYALVDDLAGLARTEGNTYIAVGNGHAAWEMVITNTMSAGDRVLVLESGLFAPDWGHSAAAHGVIVEELPAASERVGVDPAAVADRLAADPAHEITAVLVVHTDTASSVRNDLPAIRAALDAANHPALLMVDAIASLGCERFAMDAWGIDVTVAAAQKGLMCPPGISFVWANDRAMAAYETAGLRNSYWDWAERTRPERHYKLYAGTPPSSHIRAMSVAMEMLKAEGLENVWRRHEVLADAVRAAVGAWSTEGGLELNVTDPAQRSNSVTNIRTNSIDPDRLRSLGEDGAGMVLGLGIGDGFWGTSFRIGHMGYLNPPMILGTIGTVEAALVAMGAPMGASGAAAAAEVVAAAL